MEFFTQFFDTASPAQFVILGVIVLLVCFLPVLVALAFNHK